MRVPFRTTIEKDSIKQLKIIAAIEAKDANTVLEELIKEKYDKMWL